MSRSLTAQDRAVLIRRASSLPAGSTERRNVIATIATIATISSMFRMRGEPMKEWRQRMRNEESRRMEDARADFRTRENQRMREESAKRHREEKAYFEERQRLRDLERQRLRDPEQQSNPSYGGHGSYSGGRSRYDSGYGHGFTIEHRVPSSNRGFDPND